MYPLVGFVTAEALTLPTGVENLHAWRLCPGWRNVVWTNCFLSAMGTVLCWASIPAPDCSEGIPFRIEVPGAALVKPRTLAPGMFRFYSLLFLAKPLQTRVVKMKAFRRHLHNNPVTRGLWKPIRFSSGYDKPECDPLTVVKALARAWRVLQLEPNPFKTSPQNPCLGSGHYCPHPHTHLTISYSPCAFQKTVPTSVL